MDNSEDKFIKRRRFELKNPAIERRQKEENQQRLQSQNKSLIEDDSKTYTQNLSVRKLVVEDPLLFEEMFPDETSDEQSSQSKPDKAVKPKPEPKKLQKDTRVKPEKQKQPPKKPIMNSLLDKKKTEKSKEIESLEHVSKRGKENTAKTDAYIRRNKISKSPKEKPKLNQKNKPKDKEESQIPTKTFNFDTDTNPLDNSIPKTVIERVIREIALEDSNTNIRFTDDSLKIIQTEAEDFLYQLFKKSQVIVEKSKRKTVMSRDLSAIIEQAGYNLNI